MPMPTDLIYQKYADVLVNFALNGGEGVKPNEVVQILVPDVAKPMYGALQQAILKAGAHMLGRFLPTGFTRDFYDLASDAQLTFFPETYIKQRTKLIDHSIAILAEHDLHELTGVEPKKIFANRKSQQKVRQWLNDKEAQGKFTWTLGLFGTKAMAKEAGLSLEEYWQQIIKACFLDYDDPVTKWKKVSSEIEAIRAKLQSLPIKRLHIESADTDFWVTLGEKRKWKAGGGRNIPSFEIFVSPDWRGTEGKIQFNQPLYQYGNLIEDVYLEFKNGKVIKATAKKNQNVLREMIAQKDADKVGEFSLTDKRFSRIDKFMANTLFDENIGGAHGNTHLALGMSYVDTYDGDVQQVTKQELKQLGFNNVYCSVHTDIISTLDRVVTAEFKDGSQKVIYAHGQFVL